MPISMDDRADQLSGRALMTSALDFLRDFAEYAGRNGIAAAALVLFGALLEGMSLAFLVPLLGVVLGSDMPSGRLQAAIGALFQAFGVETAFSRLTLLIVLFGLLLALRAAIVSLRNAKVAELQIGFVEARRGRIAELVASAPWDKIVHLRHARVTQVMSGDIQRVAAAANFLLQAIVAIVMLLTQCVLVLLLAPGLALFAIALVAVSFAFLAPAIRRTYRLGAIVTKANLTLLNSTAQFLGGLKLAVSQNLQTRFLAEFRQTLADLSRRQISYMRQQTNSRLVLTTAFSALGALIFLAGFALGIAAPTLLTLLLVISRMSAPATQLQQGSQQVANMLSAYESVQQLAKELATFRTEPGPLAATPIALEGPIVLQNVSFVHPAGEEEGAPAPGVHSLNLAIAPGEILGVAGPSGAGKTTFADLLVGLFSPQQGRITVGGVPLDGAALAAWRTTISYISQDAFLFHDTVRRNLDWASPDASEAQMWEALALAGAESLVRRMERGLETVVGERGTLISGGERQRLALARAILRKPRLLILDEATSAIDIAGEREILDRLYRLSPRPTIVIIAHRPESIVGCDRIIRIDGGRVVADDRDERIRVAAGGARHG